MKQATKHIINYSVLIVGLMAVVIFGCRCSTLKPTPDPLAGWRGYDESHLYSNEAIIGDCNNYIKTLSPDEQKVAGPILYYEDGPGQHAVKILIGLNGESWEHVLIYDKNNRRAKTIKYMSGHYAS